MRDDEISEHCLCDKCSGNDCEVLKDIEEQNKKLIYQRGYDEGAKAGRERAEDFQKLAADIWSVAATVKKENTDEWMEYFARKMKEFEKRYETLRHGQKQEQQGTTAGGR